MEDGSHLYPQNTEQHPGCEKTFSKNMTTEANTLETITIPIHEHCMNTIE